MLDKIERAFRKLLEQMEGWIDEIVLGLPNFIVALLVMGFALFVTRYLYRYIRKLMSKVSQNASINNLVANISTILFIGVAFFLTLGILNLDQALTSLLAGAGVVGLAVGLALQDPLVNAFSGVILSIRRYYNIGDWVSTNGYEGSIEQITLRTTLLKNPDGTKVILPNKMVVENPLENHSLTQRRRVAIQCGVGYSSDLEAVEKKTKKAIQDHFNVAPNQTEFYWLEFGGSSINFEVRFWQDITNLLEYKAKKSEAIKVIKQTFDKAGINIPFPIRTIDIKPQQIKGILKNTSLQHTDAINDN
jgi:small conductance mechanosensitive channel